MLKTGHPVDPEELMAYLDGELGSDRAAVAAQHLERCAECKAVADGFRGVSQAMSEWQVEESRVEMPAGPRVGRWRWRWVGLAAAAGLAAMVGVVISPRTHSRPVAELAYISPEPGLVAGREARATVLIARTAQLELAAADFGRVRAEMEAVVNRHQGFVGQLSTYRDAGQAQQLTAQLQIPAGDFTAALAELRRIGRVVSESQTAEDVTRQSEDLEARLANSRITEQRLRELLAQRTGKLSEVLEAEQQIARVRLEIEGMESTRKGLRRRVEFVTISVTLREQAERWSAAARSGWQNLGGAAEWALAYGPVLMLIAIPMWAIWRYRRRGLKRSA